MKNPSVTRDIGEPKRSLRAAETSRPPECTGPRSARGDGRIRLRRAGGTRSPSRIGMQLSLLVASTTPSARFRTCATDDRFGRDDISSHGQRTARRAVVMMMPALAMDGGRGNRCAHVDLPERVVGFLDGKVRIEFMDDFDTTEEELFGLGE